MSSLNIASGDAAADSFTVDSDTYTMTAIGLIQGTNLYDTVTTTAGSFVIDSTPATAQMVAVSADNALSAVSASDTTYAFVDNVATPTLRYINATVDTTGDTPAYTLTKFTSTNTEIVPTNEQFTTNMATVTAATGGATINADFNVNVVTSSAAASSSR